MDSVPMAPRLTSRAGIVEVLNDRGFPSLTLKRSWEGLQLVVVCTDHDFGGHYNPRISTFTTTSDALTWMALLAKDRLDLLLHLARATLALRAPSRVLVGPAAAACAVARAPAPASGPISYFLPGFAPSGLSGPGSGATGPAPGLYVPVTRKVSLKNETKQAWMA